MYNVYIQIKEVVRGEKESFSEDASGNLWNKLQFRESLGTV